MPSDTDGTPLRPPRTRQRRRRRLPPAWLRCGRPPAAAHGVNRSRPRGQSRRGRWGALGSHQAPSHHRTCVHEGKQRQEQRRLRGHRQRKPLDCNRPEEATTARRQLTIDVGIAASPNRKEGASFLDSSMTPTRETATRTRARRPPTRMMRGLALNSGAILASI